MAAPSVKLYFNVLGVLTQCLRRQNFNRNHKVDDSNNHGGQYCSPSCDSHSGNNELSYPNYDCTSYKTDHATPPTLNSLPNYGLNSPSKECNNDCRENCSPEIRNFESWYEESDEHQH